LNKIKTHSVSLNQVETELIEEKGSNFRLLEGLQEDINEFHEFQLLEEANIIGKVGLDKRYTPYSVVEFTLITAGAFTRSPLLL
jgi:hypothetical protein